MWAAWPLSTWNIGGWVLWWTRPDTLWVNSHANINFEHKFTGIKQYDCYSTLLLVYRFHTSTTITTTSQSFVSFSSRNKKPFRFHPWLHHRIYLLGSIRHGELSLVRSGWSVTIRGVKRFKKGSQNFLPNKRTTTRVLQQMIFVRQTDQILSTSNVPQRMGSLGHYIEV